MNSPVLTAGWIEPLCEDCYNKRIAKQRLWHEKNCKGRVFNYTPYEDIKKEQQKIERIVTYKHYSSEQGELKEKGIIRIL